MKKYLILVAAVAMQMCLGATYSWSVYVGPLKALTGLGQGPVQLPFTIFYFAFPATMVVAGKLLPKFGPRWCAVSGGVLFGCGWLLAGLGSRWFGFTAVGIGALAGIGAGIAYIVPLATCIRWFPDRKGLVTGVAVAGFGGGAALVSQVGGWLMSVHGYSPFGTFMVLGMAFLTLITCAGWFMQNPPDTGHHARQPALSIPEIVSSRIFIVLYIAMFTGLAAGFTVNANLKELYTGASLESGLRAVAMFAIANTAGRILWGLLFDRISVMASVTLNLIAQAVTFAASGLILTSNAGLTTFALLAGFNYGGVLVIYASTVARCWGEERVGQVYGLLFSANIPAAFAPMIAGAVFDGTGSFTLPLAVIATTLLLAAIGAAFLLREPKPGTENLHLPEG